MMAPLMLLLCVTALPLCAIVVFLLLLASASDWLCRFGLHDMGQTPTCSGCDAPNPHANQS